MISQALRASRHGRRRQEEGPHRLEGLRAPTTSLSAP